MKHANVFFTLEWNCLSSRKKFLFLQILTFPGWYINSQRPLCFPANTACPVWRMHSAPALQDSVFPIVSGSSEPGNDRKYSWECSLLLEFGPLPHPSVTFTMAHCLDGRSHNTTFPLSPPFTVPASAIVHRGACHGREMKPGQNSNVLRVPEIDW